MSRPRILIIRLGAVGDVVRTLPALAQMRAALPDAHLAWVVEERALPIVAGHPDLDEVILLARDQLAGALSSPETFFDGLAAVLSFARRLRARRFDVSLDFQGTFKSGIIAFAAGAPVRAGYARGSIKEGNHLFNNRRIALPDGPVHRVRRNLALLEAVGLRPQPDPEATRLPLGAEHRAEASRALQAAGAPERGFVFVYPGSSPLQAYKRYPPERFGEVARALLDAGHCVVVAPGVGEDEIVRRLAERAGPRLAVLPPTSLLGMAEVMSRSRLFVGGDTGPMHIAAALGVPVVALFGPTDPALNAPWSPDHVVLDAMAGRSGRPEDPSAFDGLAPSTIAAAALDRLGAPSGRTTEVGGDPGDDPRARLAHAQ